MKNNCKRKMILSGESTGDGMLVLTSGVHRIRLWGKGYHLCNYVYV